jgi:hypothetical protein
MPALIFVYNADSGLFNTLTDIAHKLFSPRTYPCNLCALTHSPLGMKNEWRAFLSELQQPLEFLHRDEFHRRHGLSDAELPAIFLKTPAGDVQPWIDASAIRNVKSLPELQQLIRQRLADENRGLPPSGIQ